MRWGAMDVEEEVQADECVKWWWEKIISPAFLRSRVVGRFAESDLFTYLYQTLSEINIMPDAQRRRRIIRMQT